MLRSKTRGTGVVLALCLFACEGSDKNAAGGSGNGPGAGGTAPVGGAGNPGALGGRSGGGGAAGASAGAAGNGANGGSAGATTPSRGGAGAGGAGAGGAGAGGAGTGGTNTSGAPGAGAGGAATAGAGGSGPGGGGAGTAGSGGRTACSPPASYRNLFAEYLSKSEAEIDAKLSAAFASLFQGGDDERIYYPSGSDEAYILDVNNNDVRSEGISYGMTIAVQLDKQAEFNRLWSFAKQHMAQGNTGLFNWRTNSSGQVTGNGSAPDGEEYLATALIFAATRWGDGEGIYVYSSEARRILNAMANSGLFNRSNQLVLFTQNGSYTDPSYMLPAFYEVWACYDPSNQEFWRGATSAARSFFQKTTHPTTGLAPYLANFDGSPSNALEDGQTFESDAWRVVGNIMMDHHFFGADPWQVTWAEKYAAFFASANPFADEFQLDGTPTHTNAEGDVSDGLVAQNALVGFGVSAETGAPFVQALWDLDLPTGQYRYYDGLLYMLSLLHVSGRFQLWY